MILIGIIINISFSHWLNSISWILHLNYLLIPVLDGKGCIQFKYMFIRDSSRATPSWVKSCGSIWISQIYTSDKRSLFRTPFVAKSNTPLHLLLLCESLSNYPSEPSYSAKLCLRVGSFVAQVPSHHIELAQSVRVQEVGVWNVFWCLKERKVKTIKRGSGSVLCGGHDVGEG